MKDQQQTLANVDPRRISAILLLGFAAGLPLFLTSRTLQAWMTIAKVDLTQIGLFGLVALPYSLKFLWSPFLDRFVPPFLGRRRGWLVITQMALVLAIAAMSWQNPRQSLTLLAVNALIIAFFSASQDIAVDAYRTDALAKQEMGLGAAVYILGYRVALLVTGSAALILADRISWPLVYLVMAALMALCISFSLWAPEPTEQIEAPTSLQAAIIEPFQEFFQREGTGKALLILLFITLYRLGDALVNNMATPFLLKTGFSQTDIGVIQGGMGLIATIVGTLTGGVLFTWLGLNRSLWVFGLLQALSNLAYFGLSLVGQNYPAMVMAINVENFCGGLGTAGFTAFLMSLCNPQFTATQYALLSSLMAVSRDILAASAGGIAQATGWPNFFLITLMAALPGLALLPFFAPWKPQPQMPRPGTDMHDQN